MWKRTKEWFFSDVGAAATNAAAAIVWFMMAAVAKEDFGRWLFGFNAILFSHTSGARLMAHFTQERLSIRDRIIERQDEQITSLYAELYSRGESDAS
jgi:hypothetical protein